MVVLNKALEQALISLKVHKAVVQVKTMWKMHSLKK
jgi:hypothetical protein